MSKLYNYESIRDAESIGASDDEEKVGDKHHQLTATEPNTETQRLTYELSWPFRLLSGLVWFSMSIWGIWIAIFFSAAALYDLDQFNIGFVTVYDPIDHPIASYAICLHVFGGAFMMLVGAIQLVKYLRKVHPQVHRWMGRLYIVASLIVSLGGLVFICVKGDDGPGWNNTNLAFGTYGILFLISAICTWYNAAIRKDYSRHKLWAWRLYSLALGAWLYRVESLINVVMYYLFYMQPSAGGSTGNEEDEDEDYRTSALYNIANWAMFVPGLLVVEIVFRWGETAQNIPSVWLRILDVLCGLALVLVAVFTVTVLFKLWLPSLASFGCDKGDEKEPPRRWIYNFYTGLAFSDYDN